MNIFVLAEDAAEAAHMHCDRHVVKMILESGQMLCGAHWTGWRRVLQPPNDMKRAELEVLIRTSVQQDKLPPWRMTHLSHPCTKWTQRSQGNYDWHSRLGLELCAEYTRRYGKTHKCESVHKWLSENRPPSFENEDPTMTPHAICMPDRYKQVDDPVSSYRNYYREDKVRFARWKNTDAPDWFGTVGGGKS